MSEQIPQEWKLKLKKELVNELCRNTGAWMTVERAKFVADAAVAKCAPLIEKKTREETEQRIIDAINAYTGKKISFERCAELMNINFYELATFCHRKNQEGL